MKEKIEKARKALGSLEEKREQLLQSMKALGCSSLDELEALLTVKTDAYTKAEQDHKEAVAQLEDELSREVVALRQL